MSSTATPRRSWVKQIMGLPISVLARGDTASSGQAAAAVSVVFDELTTVDEVFSPYRSDSAVTRIMHGELALADADPDVQEVARRCLRARDVTNGLFDPHRPDGRWDPSGLVKGWAVERSARHLAAVDEVDWCLNAGGDVVVLAPSGLPLTVGIQDPLNTLRLAAVVACVGGAVATSGSVARGAHIYDPRSGAAVTSLASVTVAGPSLETADILATAAYVAGHAALQLVERVDGYDALCIDRVGKMSSTAGWRGTAIDPGHGARS